MSKTLITGGAGFTGSNLARLIKPSVLLDWRKPGFLFEDSEGSELIYEDCEFIHGDIRKPEDIEESLKFGEIDSIIHLAAIVGVKKCKENSDLAEEVNVQGTRNVLKFARKNDVSKVIFASSAGVYGEVKEKPITEDHPIDPLNFYSKTKVEGEKVCKEYSENYEINPQVMRMSNLYGPGFQTKSSIGVIPIFILRALLNQPLKIYGEGDQSRDFVHVKDVAQGYQKALESSSSSFETYNLGSGKTTSVNEVAEIVEELMTELYDREIEIEHVEPPEWRDEATEEFDYSIEKIEGGLDYQPEFSLKESIRRILRELL